MSEFVETISTNSEALDTFVDRAVIEAGLCRHGETAAAMGSLSRSRFWGARAKIDWVKSMAIAAVFILLAVLLLDRIAIKKPDVFANLLLSPHAMASVSGLNDDEPDGSLSEGATVSVTQGSAEITLSEGVRCILQAPGSIRLVAKGEVRLLNGSARFTVQEQAHGFRVMTDLIEVTDLGTDFGIDLSIEEQPQVHVIEGKVRVRSLSGRLETTTLTEGHAVALGAVGTLQSTPLDAKRFPGELPTGIPAVYFSFDGKGEEAARASGALGERTGARLILDHNKAPSIGKGRFGNGLHFDESAKFALSTWKGIGGNQGRTIAFWMKSDVVDNLMIMGWGTRTNGERMSNLGLRLGMGEDPGALRIESGRRWLQSKTNLTDGEWHHVVICMGQYSRKSWPETKMFVDGREETLTPRMPEDQRAGPLESFFTDISSYDATPFILGQMSEPGTLWPLATYVGVLDEVILAQGLLTDEQAKALYEGRLHDSGLDF